MRSAVCTVLSVIAGLSLSTVSPAQLYERAPDVTPGTISEMHSPGYWIARMDKPDEVVMPLSRIREMNASFRKRMLSPDYWRSIPDNRKSDLFQYWIGIVSVMPELHGLSAQALSDTVQLRISGEIEFLRSRPYGNINAIEYAPWEIDRLEREMAFENIPDSVTLLDGLTVRCTRLRNVPSFFPMEAGITGTGKSRHDLWNVGPLGIAKPLVILYNSRSGEYCFVLCEIGYGWIRSEDIAFGTRDDIADFADPDDFAVCTGDRVRFYSTDACRFSSGWFRMSDRLPVVAGDARRVRIPLRNPDGSIAAGEAWLAADADVHRGWLPYTRKTVVTVALKLLGNPYDFTGAWFGRQHETTYHDIFACFGFELPYHGGLFAHFTGTADLMDPSIGTDGQYRQILSHEPFITLMTTLQNRGGHAQLLLGKYEGVPVVLDTNGYGYTDSGGREVEVRRCIIGLVDQPNYFLKRPVTIIEIR